MAVEVPRERQHSAYQVGCQAAPPVRWAERDSIDPRLMGFGLEQLDVPDRLG